jgi:tetratricopeptide (TPR) repeat protein
MGIVYSLLLCVCLQNPIGTAINRNDGRPDLPDTLSLRAEVEAFRELSAPARAERIEAASAVMVDWLPRFKVRHGAVKTSLAAALAWKCYELGRTKIELRVLLDIDALSPALDDFEEAVIADPTNLPLRVIFGQVLVETGRPREGIDQLERALLVADLLPVAAGTAEAEDSVALRGYLRHTALIELAFAYRDMGRWDQAMHAVDSALALRPSRVANLLKGLCLAGLGQTREAMTWAIGMPPLKFCRVSGNSGGHEPQPSAYGNEWIKSQALFASGELDAASHVLGEVNRRFFQRMPLRGRFWQDAALIAELRGDPQAAWLYAFAGAGAFLGDFYPSTDVAIEPVVLGFPAHGVPYFVTPDGGFEGGSPFGYITEQMSIMASRADEHAAELARIRALDLCDGLLARGVQADLVAAFRARVYLLAEQPEFAYPDLVTAHAGFASRQVVDPGTSILLGQQELLAGNNERSTELFREAVAAVPANALAWRELGIALDRAQQHGLARQAMDRALDLEPDSLEGWFNLGVLAYRQRAYDDALRALERAWSLRPGEQRVQQLLQTVATAQRAAVRVP